jgi:hypothetical protein
MNQELEYAIRVADYLDLGVYEYSSYLSSPRK